MTAKSRPNVLFYIITLIFLLWNFIGVGYFFTEMFAADMIVAQMSEHQERIYENRPAWYMGNYALAVFAGLVACIAMLFKHRSAILFAAVSLLAVLISTTFNFTLGAWDHVSSADRITFLLVPIMGVLLLLYTFFARKKGWLR